MTCVTWRRCHSQRLELLFIMCEDARTILWSETVHGARIFWARPPCTVLLPLVSSIAFGGYSYEQYAGRV